MTKTTPAAVSSRSFADASVLAADPDFQKLTAYALQAVQLAMDKAAAHQVAAGAYPLPTETLTIERLLHSRLQRLPATTRTELGTEARARLEASTTSRRARYGVFASVDVHKQTPVLRAALAMPVPSAVAPFARRLRESDSWPDLAELLDQRAQRSSAGRSTPRVVPARAQLRVHEVLCNHTTEGEVGQDEIRIAGVGYDLYTRTESASEITRLGKFKDGERRVLSTPLVLADVPVFGQGVFDSVQSSTIFLAEKDLAGGFPAYISKVRSLSSTELRELTVVALAALVAAAMSIAGGVAGALLGAAAGAASGVAGSIIAAAALGMFGAFAGAIVGAVALLTALGAVALFGAVARWLKDEIFPPQQITNHVAPGATQSGSTPPRKTVSTSFRGGTYTITYDWNISYGYATTEAPEPPRPPTEASDPVKALQNLYKVDHIAVLMMENRSFDHMLGYLSLEGGRPEVDGLTHELINDLHDCDGNVVTTMRPIPLADTTFLDDPGHSIGHVKRQLFGALAELPGGDALPNPGVLTPDMSGFVDDFKATLDSIDGIPIERRCDPVAEDRRARINEIMGYHRADQVATFDRLSTEFAVCDHWFSSFPGNTWVNRTIAKVGRAARRPTGELITNNDPPGDERSFVRTLDEHDVSWAWYAQDVPSIALVDTSYALSHLGRLRSIRRFLSDAASGQLPSVSWIDPNFMDVGTVSEDLAFIGQALGLGDDDYLTFTDSASDDHPPTDVTHGQEMIFQVFWALFNSPVWEKTMLIVTYDEHGGFYDHVAPPNTADGAAEGDAFTLLGARVPTIVVSPYVGRGLVSHKPFDHTSIIKTMFVRFGIPVPADLPRVAAAEHLGRLLDEPTARFPRQQARSRSRGAAAPRFAAVADRLGRRLTRLPPPLVGKAGKLTELQEQIRDGRQRFADALRAAGRDGAGPGLVTVPPIKSPGRPTGPVLAASAAPTLGSTEP